MKFTERFIIIDDDPLSNFIIEQSVHQINSEISVVEFTDPAIGLAYISENNNLYSPLTILFLDLNLPPGTGWDFLEKFSGLDETIRSRFTIYMLSSSTNLADQQRASEHPFVKKYLIKPVPNNDLKKILSKKLKRNKYFN